jgi:hypothetical protein
VLLAVLTGVAYRMSFDSQMALLNVVENALWAPPALQLPALFPEVQSTPRVKESAE